MNAEGRPEERPTDTEADFSAPGGLSASYPPSDVSGKPIAYGNSCGLEEVVGAFDELLLLPDHGAVYVTLAGVVANYAHGDVVWPLLVGPSGCGKSELITAVTSAPGVWPLSSLTPQTLLSGFERKGTPASLLLQIGKFGILAFKDLTTVLTMHREARSQIIGQLREVADGKTEKNFGNGLRLEWEGKLGFLAGVTPIIDEQHSFISVMGERFLLYRLPEVPRAEIARRSLARRGREPELRQRIRATVGDFLEQFVGCGVLALPDNLTEHLVVLSDMVTRARSGVPRDYNGNLAFIPEPEAPTRLAKQLAQLGAALLKIGVDKTETGRLIRKAGWDSVPAVRCAVLDCLARQPEPVPMSTIQEETGLPERTAARVVEDVVVLGLARREKDAGKWLVAQSEITRYWKDEALPETSEGVHNGKLSAQERATLQDQSRFCDGCIAPLTCADKLTCLRLLEHHGQPR
jgi:hypothetical protein